MSHDITRMPRVKDPAKRLSQVIRWIDDSRDVFHNNITAGFPILDCKEPDINMTRPFSRFIGIDNINCRLVIFIDGCWTFLWKPEFAKDRSEKASSLGGRNSSNEFSFSGA